MRFWRAVGISCLLFLSVSWVTLDSLFSFRAEKSRSVEIPDYCGQVAEEIVFEDFLEVRTEYRYDENTPTGVVISQKPGAGNRRKLTKESPTCELLLVVSLGEESLEVPNVMGQDGRSAAALLRELGFAVEIERKNSTYPEGTVFEISPRQGTRLPRGGEVRLTVSDGIPGKTVAVPDVRGLSRGEALVRVWQAGLSLDGVREVDSDEASGVVIDQSLRPHTLVTAGSGITLYVSREKSDDNQE